jgi:altronate dehydratase
MENLSRNSTVRTLEEVARIPASGDNVAIATETLERGSRVLLRHLVFEISHRVLEGHRFAIERIDKGGKLLSWGVPFGSALRPIEPGEYICNEKILNALAVRQEPASLPTAPNFSDYRFPYKLQREKFRAAEQIEISDSGQTFSGFQREKTRGVGTRNHIVILGTSSRAAGFVRQLAARFEKIKSSSLDGIVAIEHTEGGGESKPHNFELSLRTLAGFMVNPNVGAVLAVDAGNEVLNNAALKEFLHRHDYPLRGLAHDFFSIGSSFEESLNIAEEKVRGWLSQLEQTRRADLPLKHLRLGLQCGGSDAFSGVSANPLIGILAREIIRAGGSANLAETDELIGAEGYILEKVRNLETAEAFLEKITRFQHWAAWHGQSAEGNPSGGNMFRGLYNIIIKSIGAARKKDPAVRLDYVSDFGERMIEPGFYFMDSPGNDLESIAGQVAAGCNMILFATGNGSITNFPFVPTIKVMTTTRRFELVRNEMDFNAGRFLEGEPLEQLGRQALELLIRIASGERSAGEKAGHSQVQLWREWQQTGESVPEKPSITGVPVISEEIRSHEKVDAMVAKELFSAAVRGEKVGLVLPTSLCSGQIAQIIAESLNRKIKDGALGVERAVALRHTEGCGNSAGESEELFMRTMAGYINHPLISQAVLLEHGCEKTHNDAFRAVLRNNGAPEKELGWASVQLDGGIEKVIDKVMKWFGGRSGSTIAKNPFGIAFGGSEIPEKVKNAFEIIGRSILNNGGAVVLPNGFDVWPGIKQDGVSLDYGQKFKSPGLYTMNCPTSDTVEVITGLGATGARLILIYSDKQLVPGNPLVPTLQATAQAKWGKDVDYVVENHTTEEISEDLIKLMADTLNKKRTPRSFELGNTAFQITRGYTGISL